MRNIILVGFGRCLKMLYLVTMFCVICMFVLNSCQQKGGDKKEKSTTAEVSPTFYDHTLVSLSIDYYEQKSKFDSNMHKVVDDNDTSSLVYAYSALVKMHIYSNNLLYDCSGTTLNRFLPIDQQSDISLSPQRLFSRYAINYSNLEAEDRINAITKETIQAYSAFWSASKSIYNNLFQTNHNTKSIEQLETNADILQYIIEETKTHFLSYLSWVEVYYECSEFNNKGEILSMCNQMRDNI